MVSVMKLHTQDSEVNIDPGVVNDKFMSNKWKRSIFNLKCLFGALKRRKES